MLLDLPQHRGQPSPGVSQLPVPVLLSWSSKAWSGTGVQPCGTCCHTGQAAQARQPRLPWTRCLRNTEQDARHLHLCCQGKTPGPTEIRGKDQLGMATPNRELLARLQRETREGAWIPRSELVLRPHSLSGRTTLDLCHLLAQPHSQITAWPTLCKATEGPPQTPHRFVLHVSSTMWPR